MSEKSGFEHLMSQMDGVIFHPLTLGFIGFAVLCVGIVYGMPKLIGKPNDPTPIDRLKALLGMPKFPTPLFVVAVLLWGTLLLTLTIGLFTLLVEIVWNTLPSDTNEGKADFRFLLTKTTALTAVLGAMVALPFTVIRLKLTTAQNRHNEDVLFNDKLNDANNDLHSRYQKSEKQEGGKYVDIWQDDIIRRNGAIHRLEALAAEGDMEQRQVMAPRIAGMLCVYLKEITRDYPAKKMPESLEGEAIYNWAQDLKVKRPDMESAAQVLGRLHGKTGVPSTDLAIDLSGVNLQAMNLSTLNFNHSIFIHSALDGTKLNSAWLIGARFDSGHLNGAHLYSAHLNDAQLNYAELNGARLNRAHLNNAELNDAELNWSNLNWANLSGAELETAEFKGAHFSRTDLKGTQLRGAILSEASIYRAKFNERTDFRDIHSVGPCLRSVDLREIPGLEELVVSSFGDASVRLPDNMQLLVKNKWPDTALTEDDFETEWALFKKDLDAYIPPQLRKS